jgi:hypothetical protein
MTLVADDNRQNLVVNFEAKSALAPTNPVKTTLYVAGESSDGTPQVVEMTPQIPGQLNMFGGEHEAQAVLRILHANEG